MSIQGQNSDVSSNGSGSGCCLYDLLYANSSTSWNSQSKDPRGRLENMLCQPGNNICADCESPDPKWVSLSLGVFICIKCSGVHRSLGVHVSKVVSVNLDEWTNEQVDSLMVMGGNNAVNLKYEAHIPDNLNKPKACSSIEERSDFIRRKYELQQFLPVDEQLTFLCPSAGSCLLSSHCSSSSNSSGPALDKKQTTSNRIQGLGQAFRNSWRRKETDYKGTKKGNSMAGMVEFVGLIKVNVVQGTNLAIRDILTSDPYVIITLGHQSVKTRVIRNNLNPIWNEELMLSIPQQIPPLKLIVFDKDTFKNDDFMGDAEIDIQPLVSAAKASEISSISEPTQLGKWVACKENTLVRDSIITFVDGKVKQVVSLRLQNVERGVLDLELECVPLTQ